MPLYKYSLPVYMDGSQLTKDVDVSARIPDARKAIWTLYDPDFLELIGSLVIVDSAVVRITATPALAEGDYQLIGIG